MANKSTLATSSIKDQMKKTQVETAIITGSFVSVIYDFREDGTRYLDAIECMFLGKYKFNAVKIWFDTECAMLFKIGSVDSDFEPVVRIPFEKIYSFLTGEPLSDGTYLHGIGVKDILDKMGSPYYIRVGIDNDHAYKFQLNRFVDCEIPEGLTYSECLEYVLNKMDQTLSDPNLPAWRRFDIWKDQAVIRSAIETNYYEDHPGDISGMRRAECLVIHQHISKTKLQCY